MRRHMTYTILGGLSILHNANIRATGPIISGVDRYLELCGTEGLRLYKKM